MNARHRDLQASDLERENERLGRELADREQQIRQQADQTAEQQKQIADAEKQIADLERQLRLFWLWHKFRGSQIDRNQLLLRPIPIQKKIFELAERHLDNSSRTSERPQVSEISSRARERRCGLPPEPAESAAVEASPPVATPQTAYPRATL
jgi:septal ring factor EnvC (AmiA/AmiB activator)